MRQQGENARPITTNLQRRHAVNALARDDRVGADAAVHDASAVQVCQALQDTCHVLVQR